MRCYLHHSIFDKFDSVRHLACMCAHCRPTTAMEKNNTFIRVYVGICQAQCQLFKVNLCAATFHIRIEAHNSYAMAHICAYAIICCPLVSVIDLYFV